MKATPESVERFRAAKRIQHIEAKEDAEDVRHYLLNCLDENEMPRLKKKYVISARKADPTGDFPSHATLMLCYEHEL